MNTQFTRRIYRRADFNLINGDNTHAVFLKRRVPTALTDFLCSTLAQVPSTAMAVWLDSANDDLAALLTQEANKKKIAPLSNLNTVGHRLLLRTLAAQVATFRRYSGREKVSLEIHINRNNLPKFHVDGYPHVMTRTLIGKGTLWVPRETVDESTRESYYYPQVNFAEARQVPTGWITFERGGGGGFIHSSPLEEPGTRLLVICVDRSDRSLPSLYDA